MTAVNDQLNDQGSEERRCPIHMTNHLLGNCKAFRTKSLKEKIEFLRSKGMCFRCCKPSHMQRDCTENVQCEDCGEAHTTAMHANGEEQRNVYAIIDDQSNRSLAKFELFDLLHIQGEEFQYTLASCNGRVETSGRRGSGCVVETLDGSTAFNLPALIECDQIPDAKDEIPTPDVAENYPHLHDIVSHIPPLDNDSGVLILIGRDLIEAHHVLDQRIGPNNTPYARRLSLGWVITGETCLGKIHRTESVNVNKTNVLWNGRPSVLNPCRYTFEAREKPEDSIGRNVFDKTEDDEKPGLSMDDREFLTIMDGGFGKGCEGNWVTPLPFRSNRPRLANNRTQASLRKNPLKKQHFMQRIFDSGHAELAPERTKHEECWYLPIVGVYHHKKPGQIRGVFDSSAKYNGVSLNDVLLSGPDLTNNRLGVLIRFRREPVAITADIQQMFHCFKVQENSPSPSIATYGLRKTVSIGQDDFDTDVKEFIDRYFYVDDGLVSLPSSLEAVSLMKRTQKALIHGGNLRLQKIASNREEVMRAFPVDDLAKDLKELDLALSLS